MSVPAWAIARATGPAVEPGRAVQAQPSFAAHAVGAHQPAMRPGIPFSLNWPGLAMVMLAHALVLAALLALAPSAPQMQRQPPLMASLILPPAPPRVDEPPRPLPARPRVEPPPEPLPPLPVLSATESAPAPAVASAPPPVPEPMPAVPPPPAPVEASPAAVAAATTPVSPGTMSPPTPPAPRREPVEAPRYDADYLDNPAPAYPALARRLGEQGRVLLRVYVLADGTAGQVEIRESSGHERLDRAAREAVARWRFVPARQGERPVAAWVLVPISFNLGS